jgi:hypothetical protein
MQDNGRPGAVNFLLRNNSFAMPLGIDAIPTNFRVVGNAMPYNGCVSGVTYAHDVVQDDMSRSCGTDKTVMGSAWGVENIGFIDPANGNLNLKSGSPAINAGDSSNYPATDINGHARPMGPAPDAGADEAG